MDSVFKNLEFYKFPRGPDIPLFYTSFDSNGKRYVKTSVHIFKFKKSEKFCFLCPCEPHLKLRPFGLIVDLGACDPLVKLGSIICDALGMRKSCVWSETVSIGYFDVV